MKPRGGRVLIVDRDIAVAEVIVTALLRHGIPSSAAQTADEALEKVALAQHEVAIVNPQLAGLSGFETTRRLLREHDPELVVIQAGFGSLREAVAAMRAGAFEGSFQPARRDELVAMIERAFEHFGELKRGGGPGLGGLVGRSAPMREVFETIRRVAASSSRSTVLIEGESGTGKELVARAIHDLSEQCAFPFISVHCSAIPTELLESELFGHERGAFTGAIRTQRGKFELAGRGTLLLDEVGTLDPRAQVDLLRVLQEREFTRIGGSEVIRTQARVIATTNEPLRELVRSGRIREDLYYRLRVVRIELPPLRQRVEDIPLLADHFLSTHAHEAGRRVRGFSATALEAMRRASWRGNVRELAHAVESGVVVGRGAEIDVSDLPAECFEVGHGQITTDQHESLNLANRLGALERTLIARALKESGYNRVRAAKRLGITDRALRYKLRNHGIDAPRSSSWMAVAERESV